MACEAQKLPYTRPDHQFAGFSNTAFQGVGVGQVTVDGLV